MAVDFIPVMGDYKTLQPFRYWCQKVLPLVYDDSLSYYELLNKVVDYLNKTMEDVETLHGDVEDLHEAYILLQGYVNEYFDNLDVQEEINEKLDEMASNGSLSNILNPIITANLPPIVVSSTTEMVDKSKMYILSSSGHLYQWSDALNSFGDTGLSYGTIANFIETKIAITEGDLNNLTPNTLTILSYPTTGSGFVHNPADTSAYVITLQFGTNNNAKLQMCFEYNTRRMWVRQCTVAGVWSSWVQENEWFYNGGTIGYTEAASEYSSLRDLNNVPNNTFLALNSPTSDSVPYTNIPNNTQQAGWLFTWGFTSATSNIKMQEFWSYTTGKHYHRIRKATGTWSSWTNDDWFVNGGFIGTATPSGDSPYYAIRDLNDAPLNTILALNSLTSSAESYVNTPNNLQTGAYLMTFGWGYNATAALQIYFNYSSGAGFSRKCSAGGEWSSWTPLTGSTTYNTTQNITENTYENTYNITSTPTITTDTNGWLASTGDTTDRTSDIMTMLTQTGYCHLGEGTFYVGGQIEMPANSTLIGCGKKTIIRLSSGYEGTAIIPTDYCTIKDLAIRGNGNVGSTVGGEVGILIYDTKTGFDSASTHGYRNVTIDNIQVTNLNGVGIKLTGTGGSTREGSIISNCYIESCSIGIYLAQFTEYHKITACIVGNLNYIGVINNGGNNSFVNCTISGSNSGFVIDNSSNDLVNEAHGQCIGCTFNHVGSNTGDAVRIIGTNNGFLFSGCNIWYGYIRLNSSSGIHFTGCNSGGASNQIIVSSCTGIMFNDMQFYNTPTINSSNNTNLRFINCYNFRTGESVSA